MFTIPTYKQIRVILDTDAACEADDPFAIVHALLSPKLIVKGICAAHFASVDSMERSYEEIKTILEAMEIEMPVFRGQTGPLSRDKAVSEAAAFIAAEAMREDERPLFVLCQGAITNVAKAIEAEPGITERMTIIWIGTHGSEYGLAPFREFNAGNDVEAANFVLQRARRMWLVPADVYTTVHIGIAEIERRIAPCGKIGKHLFDNMVQYNNSPNAAWTQGESWSLGDSPAIGLAVNPGCGHFTMEHAPRVEEDTSSSECPENPVIRIYKDVDSRYVLEDLIAKLELFAR